MIDHQKNLFPFDSINWFTYITFGIFKLIAPILRYIKLYKPCKKFIKEMLWIGREKAINDVVVFLTGLRRNTTKKQVNTGNWHFSKQTRYASFFM